MKSDNEKKIVRLAVIRENEERGCPFSLKIPEGCLCAGKLVDNMTPTSDSDESFKLSKEEKGRISDANHRVLILSEEKPMKCKYANFIFQDEDKPNYAKTECSYGDFAAGVGPVPFQAAVPLNQYLGVSMFSIPIGYYNQDLTYADGVGGFANRYFASEEKADIVKEAEKDKKSDK